MRRITVTDEKRMTVPQRKEAMPYEVIADGTVIGVFSAETAPEPEEKKEYAAYEGKVTCPNCKFIVQLPEKDKSPYFFSISFTIRISFYVPCSK